MSQNKLQGKLPTEFASWSKLYMLNLGTNNFTGSIPPSIGNISSLRCIYLNLNNFAGGIPLEVAYHAKLEILSLAANNLSGIVPIPLYNISSLSNVSLVQNELEGTLPADLGFTLPKLQEFDCLQNRFSGSIPPSLANASNLVIIDIAENKFTGPIPNNLGSLPNLQVLSLGINTLGENMRPNDWSFLNSLVNCTHLKTLSLHESSLRGELPNSIVNFSATMEELHLYRNHIYGAIPREIGKLKNFRVLTLYENLLNGTIPKSIGELSKLGVLDLSDNNISGVIPTSISNTSKLLFLNLENNMLQGSMPHLFNISTLQELYLANNRIQGLIPDEIVFFARCINLDLSKNLFTGSLSSNIGSLKQLVQLDVSYNKLTGDIPTALSGCVMLEELRMQENLFQGKIPSSFKALKSLRILDLSRSNLSESIPRFFVEFHLIEFLNLSHNKLGGEVPREGLFSNVSAFSVVENSELCGGVQALHFPACPLKGSRNKKNAFSLRIILILVPVSLGILSACLALICYLRQKSKKLNDPVPVFRDNQYLKLSYQDLLLATNEFSPINMLGEGRYGSVYKGFLESMEQIIAVKVLNVEVRGASKSFLAECEMLRNIRHRNLIKTITACSSTDFKGNEFKALVFEFMTNGSVEDWLHPNPSYQENERNLTLLQRLNISIDVAQGVDYLHHHSHAGIIHGDIKPSNVLLDEEFVARIGDFGLARFAFATTSDLSQAQMSSAGVRGTVGYVPPEYGMCGKISAEGDVYSYGIFLLEMFSGKRPIESSILVDNDNNLHDHVRKALPLRVMDIVDP
ncbi:receptor kinase-like protein Xa21 [Apium graveolens]|uniref:receptor kinase-like protein Xa21 n=1 Tax=Apium graveolens TaxID=4045 RepID=UPI003D7B8A51